MVSSCQEHSNWRVSSLEMPRTYIRWFHRAWRVGQRSYQQKAMFMTSCMEKSSLFLGKYLLGATIDYPSVQILIIISFTKFFILDKSPRPGSTSLAVSGMKL